MTADGVRKLLEAACAEAGTAKAWAIKNGVSPQYVSDVLTGGREPGETILKALGLERVMTYRRKQK